ncbi:MAG: endo-1,4-beta-xylanase [Candidatus Doudnabacteria bacterium]|nr:endo-1,4-beta-xylanase [Candidatus Doudnabacteria bacterium]
MKKFWKIIGIILILGLALILFFYFRFKPASKPEWGLTFSYREARGLGFDWKTMYLDILADLKPKNLRLMTYWDDIERERGNYDFSITDQLVAEAQKQNVNVLLVVGRKQPRWPECHEPGWYKELDQNAQDQAVLDFIKTSVEHFRPYTAITQWQVENEPNFSFGPGCPVISHDLLRREVDLVRSLDSRPIMVTDSGDRGSWIGPMKSGADNFGFTLYRLSYDEKYGGYYKYPLPPAFYRVRAGILQTLGYGKEISDVELQMEPWFTNGALNTPLATQNSLMNPKVFNQNAEFARKTGVGKHYLWGVEWWYWMAKTNNDWGMWEAGKELLNN